MIPTRGGVAALLLALGIIHPSIIRIFPFERPYDGGSIPQCDVMCGAAFYWALSPKFSLVFAFSSLKPLPCPLLSGRSDTSG